MDSSSEFDSDWFQDKVNRWSEGSFWDIKRQIYLYDRRLDHYTSDSELQKAREGRKKRVFDLLKDIIAFANIARRTGKPCFVFMGVEETEYKDKHKRKHTRRIYHDLIDQYASKKKPKKWNRLAIDVQQKDYVESVYRTVLDNWIVPQIPDFTLEYGFVQRKFVSYLKIKPTPSSQPFALSKAFNGTTDDTVFVRKCSSSVELTKSEVPFFLSVSQAAYLEKNDWEKLITVYKEEESLYGEAYFRLEVVQQKVKGRVQTVSQAVIDALDIGKQTILITGHAGEGKTDIIRRITYVLADRHNLDDMFGRNQYADDGTKVPQNHKVTSVEDELEVYPSRPVPVLLEFAGESFSNISIFENTLLSEVAKILTPNTNVEDFQSLISIPGSRWIILLDGLDEIPNREDFGPHFGTWLKNLSDNIQVVITARPYAAPEGLADVNFSIAPLGKIEAMSILEGKIMGDFVAEGDSLDPLIRIQKVGVWIDANPKIIPLISRPRAIEGLAQLVFEGFFTKQSTLTETSEQEKELFSKISSHPSRGTLPEGIKELITDINNELMGVDISNNDDETEHTHTFPGEYEENDKNDDELPKDDWFTLPKLALAVRAIVVHLQSVETEWKKKNWGQNPQTIADDAMDDLEDIAWHANWNTNYFNIKHYMRMGFLSNETREWNKDIGFIIRSSRHRRRYSFLCPLLHKYLAAAYADSWFLGDLENLKQVLRQKELDDHATQEVIDYINQIRESSGRDRISIQA